MTKEEEFTARIGGFLWRVCAWCDRAIDVTPDEALALTKFIFPGRIGTKRWMRSCVRIENKFGPRGERLVPGVEGGRLLHKGCFLDILTGYDFDNGHFEKRLKATLTKAEVRAQGRVRTYVNDSDMKEPDVKPGTPIQGKLELSWEEDPDPQTREELISAIVSNAPKLKQFIYAELKDIAGLSPDTLDKVADAAKGAVKQGLTPEPRRSPKSRHRRSLQK